MYVDGVHFIALIIDYINVLTAILEGGKVKLTFVGRSGSNQSVFYLYMATSMGLRNNPMLYTCTSMYVISGFWHFYG